MSDMQKVLQTKEKIMDLIRQRGPELPVKLANTMGISNIFTSAFMSELVGEQKLKISHMRVGSSPLYYILGQEEQLQKYANYLNNKEKEAFGNLKDKQILQDDELEPAIRVALRSLKDFAVQIQISKGQENKIFWKIHTLSNEDAKNLISLKINPKEKEVTEEKKEILQAEENKKFVKEQISYDRRSDHNLKSEIIEGNDRHKSEEKINSSPQKSEVEITEKIKEKTTPKEKIKLVSSVFLTNIKEILANKDFEVLSEILIKKKEYVAKIRTNTQFGKQEFYLIAKEKKKINSDDLTIALQKAQAEKMPALIMSTGEIDKKSLEYYKEWSNLIKHEKINLKDKEIVKI